MMHAVDSDASDSDQSWLDFLQLEEQKPLDNEPEGLIDGVAGDFVNTNARRSYDSSGCIGKKRGSYKLKRSKTMPGQSNN